MQQLHTIEWLEPARAASLPPAAATGAWTRALVCDLREPVLAPLLNLAPLPGDLEDERRPGASERSFFQARRALLRSLVALSGGGSANHAVIRYDAPGAPRVLSSPAMFVSVSSRGALAALAVSSTPVGIDLEPLTQGAGIVGDVLHAKERAAIAAMPPDEASTAFLRIWTAKEAWLKAKGDGLMQDPATLCMPWNGLTIDHVEEAGAVCCPSAGEWRERECAGAHVIVACIAL